MKKLLLAVGMLVSFSLPSFSAQSYLLYTVTNNSHAVIHFKSTDLFDLGKHVHKGETKAITYDFAPKTMVTGISASHPRAFDIITDSSCDALGLPPMRQIQEVAAKEEIKGISLHPAGNVHVIIQDVTGSTDDHLRLSCSIEKN